MFSGLDESEMTVVIDAMDEVKHKAGATVIKEGDNGDELYVVENGTLDCYK
jgi:cAMP-dependent protein kinase regulator